MPRITPSNTLWPTHGPTPGDGDHRSSPKRSIISSSLQSARNLFRPAHGTAWQKAMPSHPTTVSVDMGHSLTLNGDPSTLSTQHLSYCSALAVLSDWNGCTFDTRTLMHLTGSSLEHGLFNQDAGELIAMLKDSLASGGKIIWVGGVDSQSDFSLAMSLDQTHAGRQPLRELLDSPGVCVTIAGASGIEIKADGTFTLTENIGRGVLSEQEVERLNHFA
ncbi:hypothetical protein QF045_002018 [Pseudomonas sp. W4I3]|nr:hypothetical protein [Pseudomonas sp. W4I3]